MVHRDQQNVVQGRRGHRRGLRGDGDRQARRQGSGRCLWEGAEMGVIATESLLCQGGLHICLLTTNI